MSIFLSVVKLYVDQSNLIGYCFCLCTFVILFSSQELLAAVETERRLRSRNSTPASMVVSHLDDDYDVEQVII